MDSDTYCILNESIVCVIYMVSLSSVGIEALIILLILAILFT